MQLLSWNGLNIYPLPAQFKAEVTAEDIEQGVKGSCTDCAISKAICRVLGLPCIGLLATYTSDVTLFSKLGSQGRLWTPDIAYWAPSDVKSYEEFIANFDTGEQVSPTTFTFHLIDTLTIKEVQL